MPYNFGFKPFDRPFVNAPVGAFSNLSDTLTKKYNEGELITDAAKEYFGSIDVVQGDQIVRNELADGVDTGLNQLVTDYSGAYESKQFQRDSKAYIRKMAQDSRIAAMLETKQNYEAEKKLISEAKAGRGELISFSKEPKEAKTTFNPETGEWNSYASPLEIGQDWLGDAQRHIGKLPVIEGTTTPKLELLSGTNLPLLKTGQYAVVDRKALDEQVNIVIDEFAESNEGGRQLARKIATENEVDIYTNGELNPIVADGLRKFLYSAGNNQIKRSTQYNYGFLPKTYMDGGDETGNLTYDLTRPINVRTGISKNLGFNTSIIDGTAPNTEHISNPLPEGVENTALNRVIHGASGIPGLGGSTSTYSGDRFAPTSIGFYERLSKNPKEKEAYDKAVKELGPQLLGKDVKPNSLEAKEMLQDYTNGVKEIAQNIPYLDYKRLGEEGRSKREDATKDIKASRWNRASFSFKDNEQMSEKDSKNLKMENIVVLGEIDPKNPITSITGNESFATAYYAIDTETGDQYLFSKPESDLKTLGPANLLLNNIYNSATLKPGIKNQLNPRTSKILGFSDNISVRATLSRDQEGKIVPSSQYTGWIGDEQISVNGNPNFNSVDELTKAFLILSKKINNE